MILTLWSKYPQSKKSQESFVRGFIYKKKKCVFCNILNLLVNVEVTLLNYCDLNSNIFKKKPEKSGIYENNWQMMVKIQLKHECFY